MFTLSTHNFFPRYTTEHLILHRNVNNWLISPAKGILFWFLVFCIFFKRKQFFFWWVRIFARLIFAKYYHCKWLYYHYYPQLKYKLFLCFFVPRVYIRENEEFFFKIKQHIKLFNSHVQHGVFKVPLSLEWIKMLLNILNVEYNRNE